MNACSFRIAAQCVYQWCLFAEYDMISSVLSILKHHLKVRLIVCFGTLTKSWEKSAHKYKFIVQRLDSGHNTIGLA